MSFFGNMARARNIVKMASERSGVEEIKDTLLRDVDNIYELAAVDLLNQVPQRLNDRNVSMTEEEIDQEIAGVLVLAATENALR